LDRYFIFEYLSICLTKSVLGTICFYNLFIRFIYVFSLNIHSLHFSDEIQSNNKNKQQKKIWSIPPIRFPPVPPVRRWVPPVRIPPVRIPPVPPVRRWIPPVRGWGGKK
jgi:hypothetical protein